MTESQQTMTEFTYATGETDVIGDRFSPSVVLFWLRTSVAASNMRVILYRFWFSNISVFRFLVCLSGLALPASAGL